MGIQFFKKNKFDLSNTRPTYTVTDSVASNTGEAFFEYARNRSNSSGWSTTGSDDSANTTIEINFNDLVEISSILLLGFNWKAYTIKYKEADSDPSWSDFSTAINETNVTADSKYHFFDLVFVRKLQIIIDSTQTADADKTLRQFICAEFLGEFNVQPMITPEKSRNRKVYNYLSGKSHVSMQTGGVSFDLRHESVTNASDLELIERLFNVFDGFLVSLSGGVTTQFDSVRETYDLKDVYFMNLANEYEPVYNNFRYKNGVELRMKLVEVN